MEYKFFCDENITKKLQKTIQKFGYQVNSVRQQKLYGITNGELLKYLETNKYTLLTFDKDFLQAHLTASQGIIILDVNPNRDEFTVPLLENFLTMLKNEEINCIGEKILLNTEYFSKKEEE